MKATPIVSVSDTHMRQLKMAALIAINVPVLCAGLFQSSSLVRALIDSGGYLGYSSLALLFGLTVAAALTTAARFKSSLINWLCGHQGMIWWGIGVTYSGFAFVLTRARFDLLSTLVFGACAIITIGIAFLEVSAKKGGR
jgi:hypothetical protein